MKRTAGIIVMILSLVVGIYLIVLHNRACSYSGCFVSEAEFDTIQAERTESDALVPTLVFGEETLFLDRSARTFFYSLIEGSTNAYDPIVQIRENRENMHLAVLDGEITDERIRENQGIPLLVYTDEAYCLYTLNCTTLPLMNIECASDIPRESIPMRITLFDNQKGAINRVTVSDGTIHWRGGISRNFPKKGFRLSLRQKSVGNHTRSNHVSLLGLRQDDDWILYAAYNDQEKIRNVFASNLWQYTCATDNALGVNTGMEHKYLELFINGEYWGLYALGYPIDEKQLQIDSENTQEALLQSIGWTNESTWETEGIPARNFEIKGAHEEERIELLESYYQFLYTHRENDDLLLQGIDLDNALDFYFFLDFIQGCDNGVGSAFKNLFFVFKRSPNETLQCLYAPWDMDLTFGNGYVNSFHENFTGPYAIDVSANYLFQIGYVKQLFLNNNDTVWDALFEKYKNLRADGWSEENIMRLLDEYEADIYGSGAFLRDMQRWPDGTYNDASEGLDRFRSYVAARLQLMDQNFAELEAQHQ